MTRTISLITVTVGAALLFAVPALGATSPDWFERAAQKAQDDVVVVSRPDTHDIATQTDNGYLDAADRAQRIAVVVPTALSDSHERSAPPTGEIATPAGSASSGSEIELPQIGIGFAMGLLLGVGLLLAMRFTRGRQLAH
jgi:hypothetical protein